MAYNKHRADTRRRRNGKMIGSHHGHSYSRQRGGRGSGPHLKRLYWSTHRWVWKQFAVDILRQFDPDEAPRFHTRGLDMRRSELNWKGW